MARPKIKELCPSTLSQSLHLESCLAIQIRSLAHITYTRRTRLSLSTVHRTFKWNQTLDQTAKSFRRPSTQRKHSTGCLYKLGNGRRLRSGPILVASMLENLESRNPPSNQGPAKKSSRQALDQQTGIRGNHHQYFRRLSSARKSSHAVQLAAALAHGW